MKGENWVYNNPLQTTPGYKYIYIYMYLYKYMYSTPGLTSLTITTVMIESYSVDDNTRLNKHNTLLHC